MTYKEDKSRRSALSPSGESADMTGEQMICCHNPDGGCMPAQSRSSQSGHRAPEDDETAEALGDQRISRSKWPKDAAKRRAELAKILPQALADYFGNVTVIAAKFHVTESEIQELVDQSADLAAEAARSERTLDALLEDRLILKALEDGSSADLRFLLERRDPSKWAKQPTPKGTRRSLDLPEVNPVSVFDQTKAKQ